MIHLIILAIGAIIVFGNKSLKPNIGSDAANKGGTSTPIPTKTTPPFYAQNNKATGVVPRTTLAFTPLEGLYPVDNALHSNVLLAGNFNNSPASSIRVPISGDILNDTEQTSVAEEQATSWLNNRVGGSNVRQVLAP